MVKTVKNKLLNMISDVPASTSYKPSRDELAQRRKYEVEDALRTVTRAEEIKKNRSLMAEVKRCASEQIKNLQCAVKKK